MRHSSSRWLILVGAFCTGLLLAILFQIKLFASAQPGLLAPVTTPRPPAIRASATDRSIAPFPVSPSVQLPDELNIYLGASGERFDLWGTVQENTKTFYLLGLYADFVTTNPFDTTDELIVVHQDSTPWCERLMPQEGKTLKPLNAFMSSATALKLERQRYRHYIDRLGGIQLFQQRLSQKIVAGRGNYLLSKEQVEALHQLGIPFPKTYHLLRPNTFSDSGGSL
ncbi:MAG: hypothetical protein ACKO24_05245 [Leptolyngbyaceae cyanobacterium]